MEKNNETVLVFYVKGSGKKPYRVAFWKVENSRDIHSGCGCPAGRRMQYCKHRFQLIEGDLTNLDDSTENAKEKLEVLYNWLEDSDIGDFFEDFIKAKTGEKINNIMNYTKFLYDENIVHYKNSSMKENLEFEYQDLSEKEFENYLSGSIIILKHSQKYNLFFPENKQYIGTLAIDNIKKYNLETLTPNLFTTSEYLKNCYELYHQVDIQEYNTKMREIMK